MKGISRSGIFKLAFLVSFALVSLYPNKTKELKLIQNTNPMVVELLRTTPPYIAFQELLREENSTASLSEPDTSDTIELEELRVVLPWAEPIPNIVSEDGLESDVVMLAELTIARDEYAEPRQEKAGLVDELNEPTPAPHWSKDLVARWQQVVEKGILNKSWILPSTADIISEKAQQGIENLKQAEAQSAMAPGRVIVQKSEPQNHITQETQGYRPSFASNRQNQSAPEIEGLADSSYGLASAKEPKIIYGYLEFSDGLAMTEDHQLVVKWVINGQDLMLADANINEGSFRLPVYRAEGYVVAELQNQYGEVDGFGFLDIEKNTVFKEAQKIILKPRENTLLGFVEDALSSKRLKSYQIKSTYGEIQPEIKQKGQFQVADIAQGSELFLSTEDQQFEPSTNLMRSNKINQARLVSKKTARLLEDFLRDQGVESPRKSGGAVIIGQVQTPRGPLSRAKVSINSPGKVIYVNPMFFPDTKLDQTDEAGYFVLLFDNPGFHQVFIADSANNTTVQSLYVGVSEFASYEFIVDGPVYGLQLETTNPFLEEPVSAQMVFENISSLVETDHLGHAQTVVPAAGDAAYFRVLSQGEGAETRHFYRDGKAKEIVPILPSKWLPELLAQAKVNTRPSLGHVVGFVKDREFEVFIPAENAQAQVLYFAKDGHLLTSSEGAQGFVVVNARNAPLQIFIVQKDSSEITGRVVIPDENLITTITVD